MFALFGANSVNKRTANTFVGGPFVGGPEHLVRWSLNAGYSMSLGGTQIFENSLTMWYGPTDYFNSAG